ncbi:XRE family transcriptional regulator [Methylobacterium sp. Leaf399]|uniref:XRE family transcriptional regulator n=1 Tax=Methylobacterium sp. Leaf399 TaxID=1736364 RepID=UPI000AAEE833|nr:XRE family transcriptional regulator [Methylobacterium sp. Leaf399]
MKTVAERLKWARDKAGFADAADAIERLGFVSSTYYGHENGDRVPRADKIREYARLYNVPYVWLLEGGAEPNPGAEHTYVTENASKPMQRQLYAEAELLPVYGLATGGPVGHADFNGDVVDRIARPPMLTSVHNAYAVYVSGDSMEPRYLAGETVYVHPGKPVRKGHFVVVQVAGDGAGEPPRGYVKRFVGWSGDRLILAQFNPAGEIEFDRDEVVSVHRIVLSGEDA